MSRIDYAAAQKKFTAQKSALTRAVNSGDPEKVIAAARKARDEWDQPPFNGAWPDDWMRWERAVSDLPGHTWTTLEEL